MTSVIYMFLLPAVPTIYGFIESNFFSKQNAKEFLKKRDADVSLQQCCSSTTGFKSVGCLSCSNKTEEPTCIYKIIPLIRYPLSSTLSSLFDRFPLTWKSRFPRTLTTPFSHGILPLSLPLHATILGRGCMPQMVCRMTSGQPPQRSGSAERPHSQAISARLVTDTHIHKTAKGQKLCDK